MVQMSGCGTKAFDLDYHSKFGPNDPNDQNLASLCHFIY
jgi:hypothetical protein